MRKYLILFLLLILIIIFFFFGCEKSPLPAPEGSTLIIRANPSVVPPNGVSQITVFGTEQNGTPLRDGVEILFSATMGGIEPVSTTIKDGKAEATFYAGATPGSAVIKAMTRNGQEVTLDVTISSFYEPSTIVVSATPADLPIQGGSSTIKVTVFNEDGYPIAGVPITIITTYGSLASKGNLQVTNANGQVTDTLTVGRNSGEQRQITITATNGKITGSCTIIQEGTTGS